MVRVFQPSPTGLEFLLTYKLAAITDNRPGRLVKTLLLRECWRVVTYPLHPRAGLEPGSLFSRVLNCRVFPKVQTQKSVAIADYMWTLGHCQLVCVKIQAKTWKFWRVDAKHLGSGPIPGGTKIIPNSDIKHHYFPWFRCRICWKHTLSRPINRICPLNLINSQFLLMLMNFLQWRKTWKIWRVDANHLGSGPSNSISLNFDEKSVGSICWVIKVITYFHWIW